MRLIDQTKFPQRGNCFRACLATLLSLDIDEIPPFEELSNTTWLEAKKWLLTQGFTLVNHNTCPPVGYSIATGTSPRNPNIGHAVIARNGRQYFDPHPDRTGLVKVERYWQIERLEKSDSILPNTEEGIKTESYTKRELDLDNINIHYLENNSQNRTKFRIHTVFVRVPDPNKLDFIIDTVFIESCDRVDENHQPKTILLSKFSNPYEIMGYDNAYSILEKSRIVARIRRLLRELKNKEYYSTPTLDAIISGAFISCSMDYLHGIENILAAARQKKDVEFYQKCNARNQAKLAIDLEKLQVSAAILGQG